MQRNTTFGITEVGTLFDLFNNLGAKNILSDTDLLQEEILLLQLLGKQ